MADWTGLEPATPGVTGRYSNQLNYQSALSMLYLHQKVWWVMTGSNRRPSACKADALPAELITHFLKRVGILLMSGLLSNANCIFPSFFSNLRRYLSCDRVCGRAIPVTPV